MYVCLSIMVVPVAAQVPGSTSSDSSVTIQEPVEAVITGPQDIAVGRTIVLDASFSRAPGENVRYLWFIEGRNQPISDTVEAVFTPEVSGPITFRLSVRSTIEGVQVANETTHEVMAYDRKIVLVADASVSAEKLDIHRQAAAEAGVFLRILQPQTSPTTIGTDEAISQMLAEEASALAGAHGIVLWTEGITGLQSLVRVVQGDEELQAGIQNQNIIMITGRSLQTLARVARGPFTVLQPRQILLTRPEALNPLVSSESIDTFVQEITQRDIEYLRIDDSTAGIRPWNLLSSLVNAMIGRGVPGQTVILLLALPVIAMILTFLKQVVGITTFGLYTPSIIVLSFLVLGWPLGTMFLIFILIVSHMARELMSRWRLLYVPKMAVILTVVSVSLLILMGVSAYFGVTFSRETIFILLIMSTLSESFLNLKTEQGWMSAILGVFETIVAALICVFIVQWDLFQSFILAYPELLLLTVVADVLLGRWTGLRIMEYFRFREVFKHLQQQEE